MLPSSGVSAIKSGLSLCPVPGWILRLRTRHKAKRHRKRRGCNPWITLKGWERKGSFSKCPVCTQVAPSNEHVSKFGAFCFWKKIPERWDYCFSIRFGINERKLDLHLPTNTLKESESVSYSVVSNSATMHRSPAGSSVHGILQARIQEWVAIPSSRESSQPRDWSRVSNIAGEFFTIWATKEAQITHWWM